MTKDAPQSSFAIFGSTARGDDDAFSDRDLLIVSDDETSLREMKYKYDALGWSCTAYSWTRLQHAADYGSLFVQHLKQESRILFDPSDRLIQLLDTYSVNASYKHVWTAAASMVGELTGHLPRCDVGPMWALDVLSVGFRSLAVAKLADHGIHTFSNTGIIEGLTQTGMLKSKDEQQLSSLRSFKSLYRRGLIDTRANWDFVLDHIRMIDNIFGLGLSPQCLPTVEIIEVALETIDNNRHGEVDWYTRCRGLEAALWMLKPRHSRERPEFLARREQLLKIVKAPSVYAWHFTGGYESIQRRLLELAKICAV